MGVIFLFAKQYLSIEGALNGMAIFAFSNSGVSISLELNNPLNQKAHLYLLAYPVENYMFLGELSSQSFSKTLPISQLQLRNLPTHSLGLAIVCGNKLLGQGFFGGSKITNADFLESHPITEQAVQKVAQPHILPPYSSIFKSNYGIDFEVQKESFFKNAPNVVKILFNDEKEFKYGGFYTGKKGDFIHIFALPYNINTDELPLVSFFQYLSYLPCSNKTFTSCLFIGVDIQKNVIFPIIFE